jgi:hypothetical protein
MKKIIVTEKTGKIWEYINDGEVIDGLHLLGHGLPERVVHDVQGAYNEEDVIDKLESINEFNEIVKQVKLKAEYTVEVEDITAKLAQEQINKEAQEYLDSTDWYIIREMDAGISCPSEIKTLRANARASIIK